MICLQYNTGHPAESAEAASLVVPLLNSCMHAVVHQHTYDVPMPTRSGVSSFCTCLLLLSPSIAGVATKDRILTGHFLPTACKPGWLGSPWHGTAQQGTTQFSMAQPSQKQYSLAQRSTGSAAQHGTAQHSMTQRGAAQNSLMASPT